VEQSVILARMIICSFPRLLVPLSALAVLFGVTDTCEKGEHIVQIMQIMHSFVQQGRHDTFVRIIHLHPIFALEAMLPSMLIGLAFLRYTHKAAQTNLWRRQKPVKAYNWGSRDVSFQTSKRLATHEM
jgi:hypothetical protein